MYKPPEKNKSNRVDNHKHWPASIKNKMKWFPFLTIMEHTANKMQENKGLISSLLRIFSMFEIRLFSGDEDLDAFSIKCINCKRETGLDSETSFTWVYDEIVTKIVLNAMLHHKSRKSTIQNFFKNGNLILMMHSTKTNMKANMYKPSEKKEI